MPLFRDDWYHVTGHETREERMNNRLESTPYYLMRGLGSGLGQVAGLLLLGAVVLGIVAQLPGACSPFERDPAEYRAR